MLTAGQPNTEAVRIQIQGQVQGIGFRPWVYGLARSEAVRGRVWNHSGGVTIEAFADPASLRSFLERLARPPLAAARVESLRCQPIPHETVDSFQIVPSRDGNASRPSIPPDLATCDACRRELADPSNRRHRYAFINCTQCGPRYTISFDAPYDRVETTMRAFPMCDACRREYEDPANRRFHAQPNACPECGPRLRLIGAGRVVLPGDPVNAAARMLREGRILAVKGLGGYHLCCDATQAEAVAALRARKQRDQKPFAVMAPNLERAERLAWLTNQERALLTAPSRPIVLVRRRPASGIADDVTPGNPLLGLMLPYTPLHELLLAEADRPLVMTSGNRSDEPMACADGEALRRLGGGIADALLQHDREIANRCDDSVARVVAGRPLLLRRGRGWVPGSIRARHRFPAPILACGAHLKNTLCLAAGDLAWLGPHVGDLETHEACAAFEEAVERFQRFVGITPEIVAHDLHPDYFSTRYAVERCTLPRIGVQHHHAHAASVIAEHGIEGPVLGLVWDGTGYGTDGTAWGGELLVAGMTDFRRLATFRPIPLAGGERAIREVWRLALALLDDGFADEPPLHRIPLFQNVDPTRVTAVRQIITSRLQAPSAHGVGRYFDALGAIVLGTSESHYEGQVAMRLTFAAGAEEGRAYPFEIGPGPCPQVDLRPTVRGIVLDLIAGRSQATIAAGFHATLIAVAMDLVRLGEREVGRLPVVLSGGCFQNARLVEGLVTALAPRSRVYTHERIPPNDGGIALGQAMVAGARLRDGKPFGGDGAGGGGV